MKRRLYIGKIGPLGWAWRLFVFIVCAWVSWTQTPEHGTHQNTRYFCQHLLQGRWGMPHEFGESYQREGKFFPAYQPLVVLTPLPFLLVLGDRWELPQYNWLALIFSAIVLWIFFRSFVELRGYADIAFVLYLFVTPIFHGLRESTIWYFMHTMSCAALSAALLALRARLFFVAGIVTSYAIFCRPALIILMPASLAMVFKISTDKSPLRIKSVTSFLTGFCVVAALHFFLQYQMTGSFLQSPYQLAWTVWGFGSGREVFSINNIPSGLTTYFGKWPIFREEFPYLKLDGEGQSLWWLCPWLFLALVGNWKNRWFVFCFSICAGTAFFYLCYFYHGYYQYGMRYWTDFMVPWVVCAVWGIHRFIRNPSTRTGSVVLVTSAIVLSILWSLLITHHISLQWPRF